MSHAASDGSQDRFRRVDKFTRRRVELADATLATLGQLGYSATSLREIAKNTEFSHGVLHYYFRDKTDLITFCVRRYKERCVTRYDDAVQNSTTSKELAERFAAVLVGTLLEDTPAHQLWYDLRSQAMFEPALHDTVVDLDGQLEAMIGRVVAAYVELSGGRPRLSSQGAYAVFDGMFENAVVRHVAGDPGAAQRLRTEVPWLLDTVAGR